MSETSSPGRIPSHRLYQVSGDGENANWTQIGAAWPHKDDKGFNLAVDAVPLSGRIVMRELTERDEAEGGQ